MLKNIPKILWAMVATLSLVLAGVFGTTPANAEAVSAQFYRDADNCNAGTLVLQGVSASAEVDAIIFWTRNDIGASDSYVGTGGSGVSWRHYYNSGVQYKFYPQDVFSMRVLVFYVGDMDPVLDTQVDVVACGISPPDSDGDGVTDDKDNCSNTPAGTTVDINGCPIVTLPPDSDGDGVTDDKDNCSNTPAGTTVDINGCPIVTLPPDSDGDGVTDDKDNCSNTPAGTTVDINGCPIVTLPPPLGDQTIKAPKKVLKKGKSAKLARATRQGAKVKWASKSNTCKVKAGKLVAGKKKGMCRLTATAPAVPSFKAFSKKYVVKVK
jgi:hypothetical protein